ncbi:hypothetical protein NC653_003333 [Populus alba x Populus x berolinensis]|uniref:Rab-GAP TBC domain-containing protein n=1 Tax=Populus alba x Populus x berolinensis TaxID=444605 RepID=A0AAD6RR84_9ROSI|nr:hypothetical protein NC653_003333 [Populus alba x Populus x berolinensis]
MQSKGTLKMLSKQELKSESAESWGHGSLPFVLEGMLYQIGSTALSGPPLLPPPPPPPPTPISSTATHPPPPPLHPSNPQSIHRYLLRLSETRNNSSHRLSKKVINMGQLRRIASQGIPDGAGIRSTVWKLLLGYLAPDRSLWSSELAKKRSQYKHFKEELLMNPSEIARRLEKTAVLNNDNGKSESRCVLSRSEITHGEHPLSLGKSSVWNQFFQDSEIIEQIDRDVKRTHPDLHFFSGDSSLAKSNQEALRTILTVFAKLNPGIRYVQGMNEILAPLFYIFKNDPDEEMAACAEADTFFCFVELLSGFRDHFCQQLDNSVVGIRSTITRLSQLLKEHDEELWRHLEITTKVNPQFYAFRWITLLLTQEFNFADSLHIWDTLLSDPEGPQETLLRVCCAMLILIRRRLLAGDFTSILKLLQNYPPTNISHLLYVANKLRGPADLHSNLFCKHRSTQMDAMFSQIILLSTLLAPHPCNQVFDTLHASMAMP